MLIRGFAVGGRRQTHPQLPHPPLLKGDDREKSPLVRHCRVPLVPRPLLNRPINVLPTSSHCTVPSRHQQLVCVCVCVCAYLMYCYPSCTNVYACMYMYTVTESEVGRDERETEEKRGEREGRERVIHCS